MALLGRVKVNPVVWLSLQLALIRAHPSKLWRFASAQAAALLPFPTVIPARA